MASCITSAIAFAPSSSLNTVTTVTTVTTVATGTGSSSKLHSVNNDWMESIQKNLKGAAAATVLASAIWASPPAILNAIHSNDIDSNNPLMQQIQSSVMADAKEMASGSGSRVNKDAESLLRLGLPIPKAKEVSECDHLI